MYMETLLPYPYEVGARATDSLIKTERYAPSVSVLMEALQTEGWVSEPKPPESLDEGEVEPVDPEQMHTDIERLRELAAKVPAKSIIEVDERPGRLPPPGCDGIGKTWVWKNGKQVCPGCGIERRRNSGGLPSR